MLGFFVSEMFAVQVVALQGTASQCRIPFLSSILFLISIQHFMFGGVWLQLEALAS